ncbi:MAG: ABC transporter permease [Bifidobacteriaceae bacterium]|jgi:multidrug/hemolysin transport system permease protein|nr:ABC transporter permease [Bifidobacteriaceae bacterium]
MTTLVLAKRNIRIHLRDRASLFFSMLAPLILVVLYAAFLSAISRDSLASGDNGLDPQSAAIFIDWWLIAALVSVTSMTSPTMGMAHMAEDRASGRVLDFQAAPVSGRQIMGGYLLATYAFTLMMSLAVAILGLGYALAKGYTLPTPASLALALAAIALSALVFSAMGTMVGSMLSSAGATSAAGTILGTFSGFLAGAYVPIGLLGSGVASAISALPFNQSAVIIHDQLAGQSLTTLTADLPPSYYTELSSLYGFTAQIGSWTIPAPLLWLALALFGAVFATVCASRSRHLRV